MEQKKTRTNCSNVSSFSLIENSYPISSATSTFQTTKLSSQKSCQHSSNSVSPTNLLSTSTDWSSNSPKTLMVSDTKNKLKNDVQAQYWEPMVLGNLKKGPNFELTFSKFNIVTQIFNRGNQDCYLKQTHRAVSNKWRRNAPLQHLHKIGGWIENRGKTRSSLRYVKAGTKSPENLINEPLFSLNSDENHKNCEIKLQVPKFCQTPAQAACAIAEQLALKLNNIQQSTDLLDDNDDNDDNNDSDDSEENTAFSSKESN